MATIYYSLELNDDESAEMSLRDSDGNIVESGTFTESFNSNIYSAINLTPGTTYNIYLNETIIDSFTTDSVE